MIYVSAALILFFSTVLGQYVRDGSMPSTSASPLSHVATKNAYKPQQTAYNDPPPSCEPIHVNMVSRHGSRYATKDKQVVYMRQVMQDAVDAGLWQLPQSLNWFSDFPDGKWGQLAESGLEEQMAMGARMAHNLHKLFGTGSISVQATEKLRCQQSAQAFLLGLKPDLSRVKTHYDICPLGQTPSWQHSQLRFFDDCEKYQRFKDGDTWETELDIFEAKHMNMTNMAKIMQRMFGKIPTKEGKSRELWLSYQNRSVEILQVVYALCQTQASVSHTASQWCSIFTADGLDTISRLEYAEDLSSYYEKGVIQEPSNMACPLAGDFLNTMLTATNGSSPWQPKPNGRLRGEASEETIASLRFAHAETLMPFVQILEPLNGSLFTPLTAENYDASGERLWRGQRLFPMSSNIQMILYQCETTPEYRVRTLLNEGEVSLNACNGEVYCDWEVVKAFLRKVSCDEDGFVKKCDNRTMCV
ncbi:hypothetical protein CYMTET_36198 [Cymbomonas tetramitiformis]|uniref:Multiple inositol polyphosphate phosphatase 1 n=1 Tax=Cymbomonas tetramitiformis TaxID=36881 RepID=A0AAE0CGE8_9CHLO|nr:hypothetical protein CYMTET_36198 [Cymbomonas tetramitiformis]